MHKENPTIKLPWGKFWSIVGAIALFVGASYFDQFLRNQGVFINTCQESDFSVTDWSICSEGFRTRSVKKNEGANCEVIASKLPSKFLSEKEECKIQAAKSVTILDNFTTLVDVKNFKNPYEPSYGNIRIKLDGKIKSAYIELNADTHVLGGNVIKIPEYYYVGFAVQDEDVRFLSTRRRAQNRLDLTSDGVFQGTETPKLLHFDLLSNESSSTAKEYANDPNNVSQIINYVHKINLNSGKEPFYLTLYLGDGRSMVDPDEMKRIYGRITKAVLNYNCEDNTECNISRI